MTVNNNLVEVVSLGTPCSMIEINAIKDFLTANHLRANIFFEENTTLKNKDNNEFASINPKYRFQQFQSAWENPHSKIIWCSRGGYGSAEIIEFLSSMPKPKISKIFIGFSDISSISIFMNQQWHIPTICAPMLVQCAFDMVSKTSTQAILDVISGKKNRLNYQLVSVKNHNFEEITGELIGGCVSVIAGNFGTKNQINWDQKILFLEDEGECGERLDRYFHQISSIIKESHRKPLAIVLGNFSQNNKHGIVNQENVKIAINKFAEKIIDIPFFVETQSCLGHSPEMMPIVIGGKAIINNKNQLEQTITNIYS